MPYLLKKIVGTLLMPVSLSLLFTLIGLILLWFTHRTRLASVFVSIGFVILLFFSAYWPSRWLNTSLEMEHAPIDQVSNVVDAIVVLGGGVKTLPNVPANQQLSGTSLLRLVEGIRLFHALEQKGLSPTLILSGAGLPHEISTAEAMAGTAKLLGIPEKNMVVESRSRDTFEEAQYLKKRLSTHPFYLVTSASHMPRALSIFEKMGMHPIAAPTDFTEAKAPTYYYFIPDGGNLSRSQRAVHEYLGQTWQTASDKFGINSP